VLLRQVRFSSIRSQEKKKEEEKGDSQLVISLKKTPEGGGGEEDKGKSRKCFVEEDGETFKWKKTRKLRGEKE